MASSIQFIGKERILGVYNNKKVKYWSISQGAQFLEKGEGAPALEALLDMLIEDGSNAVYTIKLYDSGTSIGDVKSRTDYDASYNFKLQGFGEGATDSSYSGRLARERRIWELEQELKDLRRETDDKKVNAIGLVTDALADPVKLGQYINVIKGLLGQAVPSSAMGSVAAQTFTDQQSDHETNETEMSEKDLLRLQKAIDCLEANDPKILLHLEQLASLSTKNPKLFKMLLSQLEAL